MSTLRASSAWQPSIQEHDRRTTTGGALATQQEVNGQLASRKPLFRLWPPRWRTIGVADAPHEFVASTAVIRAKEDGRYCPPNLVAYVNKPHQEIDTGWSL